MERRVKGYGALDIPKIILLQGHVISQTHIRFRNFTENRTTPAKGLRLHMKPLLFLFQGGTHVKLVTDNLVESLTPLVMKKSNFSETIKPSVVSEVKMFQTVVENEN